MELSKNVCRLGSLIRERAYWEPLAPLGRHRFMVLAEPESHAQSKMFLVLAHAATVAIFAWEIVNMRSRARRIGFSTR